MFQINLISKYRSQIMGFAIIWTIVFHFYKIINPEYLTFPVSLGYGGVDIFLLLSGLGLYYSWQKNSDIKTFYKKRVFRILPAFWIVILSHDIITKSVSLSTIAKLSTLGLWIPIPHSYWYISAILAFYTAFPLYMKYYSRHKEKFLLIVILIGILLTSTYTYFNHSDDHRNDIVFFLSRIPIFFIGISTGRLAYEKKAISVSQQSILFFMSVLALVFMYVTQSMFTYYYLQNTAMNNYPFIILAPSISIFFALICSVMPNLVNSIFSFFGKISLEMYLMHMQIIYLSKHYFIADSAIVSIIKMTAFLTLTTIASWLLHIAVNKILAKI